MAWNNSGETIEVYTDYILLIIGSFCGMAAAVLIFYLFASRRRSRQYKTEIDETSSTADTLPITAKLSDSQTHPTKAMDETTAPTLEMPVGTSPPGHKTSSIIKEIIKNKNIDISVLSGKYALESVIYSGNMSTVFLGENVKLGNKWIVKYIEKDKGYLTNEEDILKRLNHISLPSIIDIFHNNNGLFIVESYIEGVSLEKILENGLKVNIATVVGWMEELSHLLNYLHALKPYPIIHCDLKPSNIMITHDDRLVLIDFGISKRLGADNEKSAALTYRYAAPEQFGEYVNDRRKELISERFGVLPEERLSWKIDNRTDIYSMGVIFFELLTGDIPKTNNRESLKSSVSKELADIIYTCIQSAPDMRHPSVDCVLRDIQDVKNKRLRMARSLTARKFATASTAFLFSVSSATIGSGAYIMQNESLSLVAMSPAYAVISEQQTAEILIQQTYPNGRTKTLDPNMITWSFENDTIARVDGSRIGGINEGETEIHGRYRNKVISVKINVVKPVYGMVNISLQYKKGNTVSTYAGNGVLDIVDGPLAEASFISPESIDIADDGTIYIADAGRIRVISDGMVETIDFEPSYITADKIRCHNGALYVLTNEWEDIGAARKLYGIIKLDSGSADLIHLTDAVYTHIEDFAISTEGLLYYIEQNYTARENSLKSIDLGTGAVYTHIVLSSGVRSLCLDDKGNIYIADAERAVIEKYSTTDGTLSYVAGIENERHFIDGPLPLFYEPLQIRIHDDTLYVLDFNVLRMVDLAGGVLGKTETLAGEVSTEINPVTVDGAAEDVTFAKSSGIEFVVTEGTILLTDTKKGAVREIVILN